MVSPHAPHDPGVPVVKIGTSSFRSPFSTLVYPIGGRQSKRCPSLALKLTIDYSQARRQIAFVKLNSASEDFLVRDTFLLPQERVNGTGIRNSWPFAYSKNGVRVLAVDVCSNSRFNVLSHPRLETVVSECRLHYTCRRCVLKPDQHM